MPTPERTSLDAIVEAARTIVESQGLAHLTMQAVAERVGVRAPSLYKRVRNRDALVQLVTEATLLDLQRDLEAVEMVPEPGRMLAGLVHALRAFAHAHPAGYHLIFTSAPTPSGPDPALLARVAAPVLRVTADLAGPAHALEAARTVTAWAHGFISMELAGAFNLGGDVDAAFEYGLTHLATALTSPPA
ncbi:WHG domain-containing protein [Streptomyces sp. NPDC004822]